MQPPSSAKPEMMDIRCSVREAPAATVSGRTDPFAASVRLVSPSSTTVPVIVFGFDKSIVITKGAPQSNVMTPPTARAASSAASVQLASVPVPTTASARTTEGSIVMPSRSAANVRPRRGMVRRRRTVFAADPSTRKG
jgi:hypothetical protein